MYQINRAFRTNIDSYEQRTCSVKTQGDLEYLIFPSLERLGIVDHLFTTRIGGVSENEFSTMNLSFTRGDDPEKVAENYRRIAFALGRKPEDIVASHQMHTTNIRVVTDADRGKGVTRERDYEDIDGLITNIPGITLSCFYADCVPLYLVDPVKRAVGLAHSGWRGTAGEMGRCMVEKMQETYGCKPGDLHVVIGPSICRDCYEVSEDVAKVFMDRFPDDKEAERVIHELNDAGCILGERVVNPGVGPGKYQLDLWLANAIIFRRAGVNPEHIAISDICTNENPNYLFSHRASGGKRGNLGAFLSLKEGN